MCLSAGGTRRAAHELHRLSVSIVLQIGCQPPGQLMEGVPHGLQIEDFRLTLDFD